MGNVSERKRQKFRGRGKGHSFLQLRHDILRSKQFNGLTGNAVKLLLFLFSQFNGRNNGDFSMAWVDLADAGWSSEATARRARDELLAAGFIRITRHGHKRRCFLFAVTWLPVDDCDGKGLEVASERVACDWWKTEFDRQKRAETPSETSGKPSPNRVSNQVIRSQQAEKPLFIEEFSAHNERPL